ncbi:MAG: class IV adenylate cyclase [Candidatus Bathyarchaeota archaeon]|nr:class IV adenylate cyclase [Candidatus Bathyarchaeota archaeon]
MREVEVKILEVTRETLEEQLARLGAQKVFDGKIETVFFDFPEHTIIKAKNLLRLRKENDKVELTFKKVQKSKNAKVAQEYTVRVSDAKAARSILEFLGLLAIECMTKRRVSYTLDRARFDFDLYEGKYAYIPEFLEIEAQSASETQRYAALLGFKSEDCLPWSTHDLIEYYSSTNKTKKNH